MPSEDVTDYLARLVGCSVVLATGLLTLLLGVDGYLHYQRLTPWSEPTVAVLLFAVVGSLLVVVSLLGTSSLRRRRGQHS